ncbi:MAG: type II secretion system protein GspF [Proteobacteria bacterium]|jgi:general secretion pathway protein F|nr:type II secretion system protein GspF [Pseudomonadota bacterium]
MPVFEYQGLDGVGKSVSGVIDADSAKVARGRLRKQGVFPTEIREQSSRAVKGSGLNVEIDLSNYLQFVTSRDISILTKQMATLLSAHVPMGDTLSALVDQTEKSKLKVVMSKIKERVNEGSTLGDAMSDHPKVFNDLYVHMVRAGEAAGALDSVLVRLAKFTEGQVKLQGQLISALAYPVLMGFIGMFILMGLFIGVIPRIRGLFDSIGGEDALPLLTRVVFLFGDLLLYYWWVPPIVFAIALAIFRRWVKTAAGRERFDRFRLRVPLFGRIHRLVAVSRFCRTMATLLVSGVPIVRALDIVQKVVGNVKIGEAIEEARHNITEGQSIAQPLKQSGQFPPMVTHMIAIGERTGELEPMLETVADSYESEVEATMAAMTAILGPGVIVILGGIVFTVALGLLMPMMSLSQMIK